MKWILKIPPHLAYVATLPCETLMSAKQATNDKLQGSVATYLRCGGVVNNQIKKGLLLSVRVQNKFKSINIWQSYKQERGCLMHFARLDNTLLKDEESAQDNRVLACYFAKYSAICGLPCIRGWLDSRVVSVLDSGAEGPGSNCSRDAVG